jgi:hypothetical protein
MAEIYFSGQGIVYAAIRNTDGTVTANAYKDLGNVPSLKLTLETDVLEHKESKTGGRLTDLRLLKDKSARVTITLESFKRDNLILLLFGTSQTITGAVVTNEVFPTVAVGDMVALTNAIVDTAAAFTIIDSTGSPITLTNGTHYTVDKNAGVVTILALTGIQPYKATYTHLTKQDVPMFESGQQERFLKFSGLNTANSLKGAVVELYRVVFDPVSNFDLITDDIAQYEITGSVLYDSVRKVDPLLGGFGRIVQV